MNRFTLLRAFAFASGLAGCAALAAPSAPPEWTLLVANDTCPDYTWGDDEASTRKNMAELVRAHLDEMTRTDAAAPENRDHYSMVTHEALHFLERYPARREELARRIREGRMMLSPNLCNTLWGFQSAEGAVRNLYPARRLQREWGMPLEVMHHIEYPGLAWGVPTLLAGCGVRWLTISFLDFDSTLRELQNPPVFTYEGPDGSSVGVVMDRWASGKWAYAQGFELLKEPTLITEQWLPHYRQLGDAFPARTMLAAGTHSDTHPSSAGQTRGFSDAIAKLNALPDRPVKWVNGTYAQFCQIMEETQRRTPFMPTLRGSFGDSWDAWAVTLARSAAAARENERDFLAAETLVTLAGLKDPAVNGLTRTMRERAEWCWTMLGDHAWNGASDDNRIENARLRRAWNEELNTITRRLWQEGWLGLGLTAAEHESNLTAFNSLSLPRRGLTRIAAPEQPQAVFFAGSELPSQPVVEDGRGYLYFVTPPLPGFALERLTLGAPPTGKGEAVLRATPAEMEGPFYRLKVDLAAGGVASLVYKPTGAELVTGGGGRTLGQTVFFDGQEHLLTGVTSTVEAVGPVFARLRIEGETAGIRVTNFVTLYANLDRVDFDLRIHKPISTQEQRLCQVFPVLSGGATLRAETTAAVIRPQLAPAGDLLPGGDARRLAVQGFVDVSSPTGTGVTIAPLDAFLLRPDLGAVTFEAIGNDQNYKESNRNQDGVTDFRFRYSLQAHAGAYDQAAAIAWSRDVATPPVAVYGTVNLDRVRTITIDPKCAIATCLKPADDPAENGVIVRLWETSERAGDLPVAVQGFQRAIHTDLLERDLLDLPISDGRVGLPLRARGFAGLRLLP